MLYQLSSKCSALETLVMRNMQLHHVEDGLGTLFESLGQHHHTNLKIWIANNNLSKLFKTSWEIQLLGLKFHDENYDDDDWLTLEESNWLISDTLGDDVTDKKDIAWREDDLLDGFYDDVEDDDDEAEEEDETDDKENGKDEDAT